MNTKQLFFRDLEKKKLISNFLIPQDDFQDNIACVTSEAGCHKWVWFQQVDLGDTISVAGESLKILRSIQLQNSSDNIRDKVHKYLVLISSLYSPLRKSQRTAGHQGTGRKKHARGGARRVST